MSDDESFLAGFSVDFVQLPQYKPAGTSTVDFDGLLSPPLKLHEDLKGGCGGQLWPAGMVLAKYLLRQHKHDLHGRSMFVRSGRRPRQPHRPLTAGYQS